METFRINSKLIENEKEILIQTSNNPEEGTISSTIYIDGVLTELFKMPHSIEENPDKIMSLVRSTHSERKEELEALLAAYRGALSSSEAKEISELGLALYFKRFYMEAKDLLRSAVTLDPEFHSARQTLALVEMELGNLESAETFAAESVSQCPTYADYQNTLGEIHLVKEEYEKAVAAFIEAIKINLYYSRAYFNLGISMLHRIVLDSKAETVSNEISRCLDAFRKSAMIDSEFAISPYGQAIKALEDSQYSSALEQFLAVGQKVKEKIRADQASYFMHFIVLKDAAENDSVESRIQYLESEINKNPSYVDLYAELAKSYLEQSKKNWQRGISMYRKTLKLNPGYGSARRCLAEAEKKYGEICNTLDIIATRS